jgi:hypothetical protein
MWAQRTFQVSGERASDEGNSTSTGNHVPSAAFLWSLVRSIGAREPGLVAIIASFVPNIRNGKRPNGMFTVDDDKPVMGVAYSPLDRWLGVACGDGTAKIYAAAAPDADFREGGVNEFAATGGFEGPLRVLAGHRDAVYSVVSKPVNFLSFVGCCLPALLSSTPSSSLSSIPFWLLAAFVTC